MEQKLFKDKQTQEHLITRLKQLKVDWNNLIQSLEEVATPFESLHKSRNVYDAIIRLCLTITLGYEEYYQKALFGKEKKVINNQYKPKDKESLKYYPLEIRPFLEFIEKAYRDICNNGNSHSPEEPLNHSVSSEILKNLLPQFDNIKNSSFFKYLAHNYPEIENFINDFRNLQDVDKIIYIGKELPKEEYQEFKDRLFCRNGFNILILPQNSSERDNNIPLDQIFCFNWDIVVDPNPSGGTKQLTNQETRNKYTEFRNGQKIEITTPDVWYMINGIINVSSSLLNGDEKTRKKREFNNRKFFGDLVKNLKEEKKPASINMVFFEPKEEWFTLIEKMADRFEADDFEKSTYFFIIGGSPKLIKKLEEVTNQERFSSLYPEWETKQLPYSTSEIIDLIQKDPTLVRNTKKNNFSLNKEWEDILKKINPKTFKSSGLELVFIEDNEPSTPPESFYRGGTITWDNLKDNVDVPRVEYQDIQKKFLKMLNRTQEFIPEFEIVAEPGSGSTTLMRRLAYNLQSGFQTFNKHFVCLVLESYKPAQTLSKIFEVCETASKEQRIILFVDKYIERSVLNEWKTEAEKTGHCFCLFRISSPTKIKSSSRYNENLPAKIDSNYSFFLEKYCMIFEKINPGTTNPFDLNSTTIDNERIDNNMHPGLTPDNDLIYFPLVLNEHQKELSCTEKVYDYVKQILSLLPEQKEFCGYLTFVLKYCHKNYVFWPLLRDSLISEFIPKGSENPTKKQAKEKENLERLFLPYISERNIKDEYRLRFSFFENPILENAFLDFSEAQITIALIDLLAQYIERNNPNDAIELLKDLFNGRDEDSAEQRREDFSPLITSLALKGHRVVEEVFEKLQTVFNMEPHFKAQYARYIYKRKIKLYPEKSWFWFTNNSDFDKAKRLLEEAISLNDTDGTLYHMYGKYWQSLMYALSNLDKNDKIPENYEYINHTLDFYYKAKDSYEMAISIGMKSLAPYLGLAEVARDVMKNIFFHETRKSNSKVTSFWVLEKKNRELQNVLNIFEENYEKVCTFVEGTKNYIFEEEINNLINFEFEFNSCDENKLESLYKEALQETNPLDLKNKSEIYLRSELSFNYFSNQFKGNGYLHIPKNRRDKMLNILQTVQKRGGADYRIYERKLLILLWSDPEELPIDVADSELWDLLDNWSNAVEKIKNNILPIEYIRPSFYMASLLILRAMNDEKYHDDWLKEAELLFKKCAAAIKEEGKRPSFRVINWLRDADFETAKPFILQSLVQGKPYEAKGIISIESNGKSVVELTDGSGVKASVGDEKIKPEDNNKIIDGLLGFRYQGLGWYGPDSSRYNITKWNGQDLSQSNIFNRSTISNDEDEIELEASNVQVIKSSSILSNNESSNTENGNTLVSTTIKHVNSETPSLEQDNKEIDIYKTDSEQKGILGPKPVGKIDLSTVKDKRKNKRFFKK